MHVGASRAGVRLFRALQALLPGAAPFPAAAPPSLSGAGQAAAAGGPPAAADPGMAGMTRVQATQAVMRPARVPRPARDQSRPPTLSLAAASARPGARHGAARLAGRWRARCDGRDWRVST